MPFDQIFKSRLWLALAQWIYTFLVLVGLPVFAWGIDALTTFFANPIRLTLMIVAVAQSLINAWLVFITPPQPNHENSFSKTRWHSYMFEILVVFAVSADRRNILTWSQNNTLRWIGLGFYLIGVVLSIWSNYSWIEHLRTQLPYALDHPVLISQGPYRLIRYPSFLFLIFYSLGFVIMFRSGIGMVMMIPLLWGIINRINDLERDFAEQYKRVWPLRRHTSKRLIPYVY